jgi:hypothetical protein
MIRFFLPEADSPSRRTLPWRIAWLVVALAYAAPVAYFSYGRVIDVSQRARERLIVEYRLWELHPEYHGTPQAWTRFASRLLTDNQLLRRVRLVQRDVATDIELDYRRDLTIAQGEVVLAAIAVWAAPLGLLYGLACLVARRRVAPPPAPAKPAYSEDKYRPGFKSANSDP